MEAKGWLLGKQYAYSRPKMGVDQPSRRHSRRHGYSSQRWNKGNNEIENLEMLDRSEHLKRHWQEGRFDLEKRRIQLTEARKWLKTPEGRKRQSEDAIQAWKERPNIEITCKNCGKKINAIFKRAQFCSDPCNYQFRRKQKGDRVQNPRKKSVKICRFCESEFLAAMPYAMYCSTKCRKRMSGGRKYLQ